MATPLPALAVDDMNRNFAAAKKAGTLFFLIPARSSQDAPWLIVDKPGLAMKRYKAARDAIRTTPELKRYFKLAELDRGELHRVQKTLVFVLEDDPNSKLQKHLASRWAKVLKGADGIDKKFCVLLQGAVVRVDADFDPAGFSLSQPEQDTQTKAYASADDDGVRVMSNDELEEFFGDSTQEVLAAVPAHHTLHARLETHDLALDPETSARRFVAETLDLSPFEEPEASRVVTAFVRMAHATDARTLGVGDAVNLNDRIAGLAARFNSWWRTAIWLNTERDALDDAREELDALRGDHDGAPTGPSRATYAEAVSRYNVRLVRAQRLAPASQAEYADIERLHAAYQAQLGR